MLLLTYDNAYFSSAYFQSETIDGTDDFNFQDSFTMEFPASSGSSGSPSFTYQNTSLTPFYGDSSYSRVYSFEKTEYFYRYGLFGSIQRPIYKVVLQSYNGRNDISVPEGGYAYVYIERDFWEDVGSVGYVPYNIYFLSENQLPNGLSYEGFSPSYSPDSGLLFLYQFGSEVYQFFPSVGSLMSLNISGYTFVDLLTSGFLVYCGFVIVKFVVGL